ncbi:hypothetical protein [Streptomyces anthocyanicus]|uniref:hypothetical protein n=1 Tax=Streptomyces anthocyanicus TaxID=68174 RepID=UPI0038094CC2
MGSDQVNKELTDITVEIAYGISTMPRDDNLGATEQFSDAGPTDWRQDPRLVTAPE